MFKNPFSKGMKLPPHLEIIKQKTHFSAKEIIDFSKKYRKICHKSNNELNMKQFMKFMNMMGVKSNATLVTRIFNLMDVDGSGSISFPEFMEYFNVLLYGTIKQKAELCFFTIAVGNPSNLNLPHENKFFTRDDLLKLLTIISESQKKGAQLSFGDDEHNGVENLVNNMMSLLGLSSPEEQVTLDKFMKAIDSDENVLGAFQMIGNDLQKLMEYQGDNHLTQVVKALKLVAGNFDRLVFSHLNEIECGLTKVLIGNIISSPMSRDVFDVAKLRSKSKKGTIIDALETRINKAIGGTPRHTTSYFMKNQDHAMINMPCSINNSSNKNIMNGLVSVQPINQKSFEVPTIQIYKPEEHQSPHKNSPHGTLNFNSTDSPVLDKLKVKQRDIEKKHDGTIFSGINIQTHAEESLANSSLLADLLKEEPDIEFSEEEIGLFKQFSQLPKNIAKFPFCSLQKVDIDQIKKIVREIEDGTYFDRNDEPQPYNLKNISKKGKHDEKLLQDDEYFANYKMGKIVEVNKRMPQCVKVERVPNPGSKIFEDFEKFLQQSRKDNSLTRDETINQTQNQKVKEMASSDDMFEKIVNSQEYKSLQLQFEYQKKELEQVKTEFKNFKNKVDFFKNSIYKFKAQLEELTNQFEEKMNLISEKEKMEFEKKKLFNISKIDGKDGPSSSKISFTSKLWGSVIAITSGIETSVNATEDVTDFDSITEMDYKLKNTFEIYNPALEKYDRTEFIDYAPRVFTLIRNFNQISKKQYLKSLGSECLSSILSGNVNSFKGLQSAGKSGSFFFTTGDNQFFVKTIPEREFVVAVDILGTFLDYLNSKNDENGNTQTLITKIYGLHKIKFYRRGIVQTTNVIVIGNIFDLPVAPQRIYDLKGSWYKRMTSKENINKGAPRKDNNFTLEKIRLKVSKEDFERVNEVIQSDCEFLKKLKIIDYSLLVGIYETDQMKDEVLKEQIERASSPFMNQKMISLDLESPSIKRKNIFPIYLQARGVDTKKGLESDIQSLNFSAMSNQLLEIKTTRRDLIDKSERKDSMIQPQLMKHLDESDSKHEMNTWKGTGMDKAEVLERNKMVNFLESTDGKYIYIIGIIDTLTFFSSAKFVEFVSRTTCQSKGASCVPPEKYADRFASFMRECVFYPVDENAQRKTLSQKIDHNLIQPQNRRTTSTDIKVPGLSKFKKNILTQGELQKLQILE